MKVTSMKPPGVATRNLMRRIFSAGLLLVCSSARAANLRVPADYPTIAAAVAAARARTDGSTTIHVAPGVYSESEVVLDVPNLTLAGTVPLARGPDGFPLDSNHQSGVARVEKDLPDGAVMFHVTAANVRITGFVLDGLRPLSLLLMGPGQGGLVIYIDGALTSADGFSIDGNLVQEAATGVFSRMASGTIRGNRFTLMNSGSASFGGRPELAKSVTFRDNLVVGNTNVGAAFQGGTGSRNLPKVADGPGSLFVEVSGNEFRANGAAGPNFPSVGLSFLINDDSRSDTTLPAKIEAHVHDNLFIENRNWGLDVAQRVSPNARLTGFEFEGTFERNRYCGNGLNEAIFAFRQITTTLGGGAQRFRFGRGSTYVIHAENDPLAWIGYDLDHPANDPDPHDYTNPTQHEAAGVPLGNTLIFNGAIVPTVVAPVLRRLTPMTGDSTPPVVGLRLSTTVLWPPNHKLVPVGLTIEAKDECTPAANLVVRSCHATSSEPGDGDASVVMSGPFSGTAWLRAERLGGGSGRVYTIRCEVADTSGNVGIGGGTVVVPHSQ